MSRSSSASSFESDEQSDEIQKFLITHLELTPRRQLFEEFEKLSLLNRRDDETCSSQVSVDSVNTLNLSVVSELSEFRKNHPNECMSNVSRQRFQRAKEREQKLLTHPCAHYYVESKSLKPNNQKEASRAAACGDSSQEEARTRTLRFAPDKSLALSNQKFKF